jgi:hypothetical protein
VKYCLRYHRFPNWVLGCTLTLWLSWQPAGGQVIPSDRRITWQGNVGVPGGIPHYSTIFTNMTGLDASGMTDSSAAIQSALNACPTGQVVGLPSGIFLITNMICLPSGTVLRGAGSSTLLLWRAPVVTAKSCIRIGAAVGSDVTWDLAVDGAQGATNLTLYSASGLYPGNVVAVEQTNDPALIKNFSNDGVSSPAQDLWTSTNCNMAQLVEIVGVAGSTVTVWPPLNYTWTTTLGARLHRKGTGKLTSWCGAEDLKIQQTTNTGTQNLSVYFAKYCWFKNIESANCYKYHCQLQYAFRCEVRDCYLHDAQGSTSTGNYGISLAFASAFNLIENNIVNNCIAAFILAEMAQGNVYGYNYSHNIQYSPTNWLQADLSSHDAHPMMNLYEGNVAHMLIADLSHGSSSHNTVFRNYLSGWQPFRTSQNRAVELDNYSTYWNVVGNVLGCTNISFQLSTNGPGDMTSLVKVLMMFGYRCAPPFIYTDPNVHNTALIQANYCIGAGAAGVPPDQSIGVAKPPPSCYLPGKPDWWGSGPWPPIGPDVPGVINMIPAQARFLQVSIPAAPPKPSPPFNVQAKAM